MRFWEGMLRAVAVSVAFWLVLLLALAYAGVKF